MSPTGSLILAVCALSAAAAAQDLPADQTERLAASALERASAAQLELLHELRWGEGRNPELFQSGIGPLLSTLAFSTDGRHLALQSNLAAWTVGLETAAWQELDTVDAEGILGGAAVAGGFLVMAAGACYRVGPDLAEAEPVASGLPDRGDLFAAPDGRRLVVSGLTPARQVLVELIDLEGDTKDRLLPPERAAHATAVAWSPDGKRVAVGWALSSAAHRAPLGVRLYDLDGSVLRTWPAHAEDLPVRSITFAFDARSLTIASGKLRRLDAQTGEVLAEADVQPLHWSHVDPVVALSIQADGITFWDADRLRPARTIPIDEEPLVVRNRRVGPVLNAVLSPRGDLLAVGTARGLRIYRIRP